jgi:hypothetical protein
MTYHDQFFGRFLDDYVSMVVHLIYVVPIYTTRFFGRFLDECFLCLYDSFFWTFFGRMFFVFIRLVFLDVFWTNVFCDCASYVRGSNLYDSITYEYILLKF